MKEPLIHELFLETTCWEDDIVGPKRYTRINGFRKMWDVGSLNLRIKQGRFAAMLKLHKLLLSLSLKNININSSQNKQMSFVFIFHGTCCAPLTWSLLSRVRFSEAYLIDLQVNNINAKPFFFFFFQIFHFQLNIMRHYLHYINICQA